MGADGAFWSAAYGEDWIRVEPLPATQDYTIILGLATSAAPVAYTLEVEIPPALGCPSWPRTATPALLLSPLAGWVSGRLGRAP